MDLAVFHSLYFLLLEQQGMNAWTNRTTVSLHEYGPLLEEKLNRANVDEDYL